MALCVSGGFWNQEKMCLDGQKLLAPGLGGAEVAWWKKDLDFHEDNDKESTVWVML